MILKEDLTRKPPYIWLAILLFLDLGFLVFNGLAYYPGNLDIDFDAVLAGTTCANQQYRIGTLEVANFFHNHLHIALQKGVLGLDTLFCLLTSVMIFFTLHRLLQHTGIGAYRHLAYALLAVIEVVNFHWCLYRVRPETMATIFYAAATILLLDIFLTRTSSKVIASAAVGLILLTIWQAFNRTDLPLVIATGECLVALFFSKGYKHRVSFFTLGAVTGVVNASIHFYLTKIRYPNAKYVGVLWTWKENSTVREITIIILFLAPVVWSAWYLLRRMQTTLPARVILCAAAMDVVLYLTFGNAAEARIYVPIVMGMAPFMALAGTRWFMTYDQTSPIV